MTRRRNGTLTAAPEQTWKCCLVDDGGSRQRSLRRPPPRSMAVVRVPEFPGWLLLLLLLVSIVSGTRRMFVCCCFARWPLPVRPGLLIRPGPSPEARRSVCLVAFQARKPSTQDTSRVADQTRPDPLRQMVKLHDETWRNGDMDLKLNSSGESGRWSGGPCHVSDAPARRDISDRHVKRCGLEVEGRLQVIKSCAALIGTPISVNFQLRVCAAHLKQFEELYILRLSFLVKNGLWRSSTSESPLRPDLIH